MKGPSIPRVGALTGEPVWDMDGGQGCSWARGTTWEEPQRACPRTAQSLHPWEAPLLQPLTWESKLSGKGFGSRSLGDTGTGMRTQFPLRPLAFHISRWQMGRTQWKGSHSIKGNPSGVRNRNRFWTVPPSVHSFMYSDR